MEGKENLYYALGELAYAVAISDGKVQEQERQKIHDIVVEGTASHNRDIQVSEIIFHVLQKEQLDWEKTYSWAMDEIRKYKSLLTAEMKDDFVTILFKVADACNSVSIEEQKVIEQFQVDLKAL